MLSSSELSKIVVGALSDGYDDEENREEEERSLYREISLLSGDSFIRVALERLCERVEDLEFVERKSYEKI